jgi:hypothetical protein
MSWSIFQLTDLFRVEISGWAVAAAKMSAMFPTAIPC